MTLKLKTLKEYSMNTKRKDGWLTESAPKAIKGKSLTHLIHQRKGSSCNHKWLEAKRMVNYYPVTMSSCNDCTYTTTVPTTVPTSYQVVYTYDPNITGCQGVNYQI